MCSFVSVSNKKPKEGTRPTTATDGPGGSREFHELQTSRTAEAASGLLGSSGHPCPFSWHGCHGWGKSSPPPPPPSWMAAGPSTVSLSCLSLRRAVTFGVMTEESRRHSDRLIHQGAAVKPENKTPKTQAYTQTNKAFDQQEGPEGALCLPSRGGEGGGMGSSHLPRIVHD